MAVNPAFVISLDFELLWGVRDHADKHSYGANILGVRKALPRMLDVFARRDIRATWATVGFLFCESKDELLASAPAERPSYIDEKLSNYSYFSEVGDNEKADPYYFGVSLLERIAATPGQEIGSHSFSHYYCLEPGQTIAQFEADIAAAVAVATRRSITLRSFVFPRNQYDDANLAVLARHGFADYRGNECSWVYRPSKGAEQSSLRRAIRLADHYVNLTGHHAHTPRRRSGVMDVAASRFLRPHARKLAPLDGLRFSRIKSAMSAAAANGGVYHLWWHPHNFGINQDENFAFLDAILDHFAVLRDRYGMKSANMGDFA